MDTRLIGDQTYFILEEEGRPVACGGWSRRRTLYGSDRARSEPDPILDPAAEPARLRAFFVDPDAARRGHGRRLVDECLRAARAAGFRAIELIATLPGEPLYLACGFAVIERFDLELPEGVRLPVARMRLEM